ncbi:hypothetical protein J6590_056043 [Homalodisca vitripennis]|nr:hypothetical protein J6590_056043 [Homalodisca vitripennis]
MFCRIRSDHNEDNSVEIVERWLSEWAGLYHEVSLEMQPSPPHHLPGELGPAHWPQARYSHIIGLREQALAFGRRSWADYVWFLDSDVFVTNPRTLHQLISKNHVVTAPMLRSDGLYSNFWCGMTDEFYYLRTKVSVCYQFSHTISTDSKIHVVTAPMLRSDELYSF